ncbi:MAG: hypothetical protein Pg6C_08340 [Treponemataceae bacterium]|nr:MAG: hypothetical protein Pg6C_08340 [Treponemataceae bacterium]
MNHPDKFSTDISEMQHSGIRKFFELVIGPR